MQKVTLKANNSSSIFMNLAINFTDSLHVIVPSRRYMKKKHIETKLPLVQPFLSIRKRNRFVVLDGSSSDNINLLACYRRLEAAPNQFVGRGLC